MIDNFKKLFVEETEYFDEDELEQEIIEETDETFDVHLENAATTTSTGSKGIVKIFEPVTKSIDSQIMDTLRKGELCIINYSRLSAEEKMIFTATLSGSVYSLDATMSQVDENILICAPKNFLVDGDVAQSNS